MRLIIVLLVSFLTACSGLPSIKPYKMDIQQGNAVTSKMLLQLKPGMTQSQVRFILGTPLIQDSFHANRWDYFYQMREQGKLIEQRRIILEFANDALIHVRGDVIPVSAQEAATPVAEEKPAVQPEEKESWVDHLKFWEDDVKPKTIYLEKPLDGTTESKAKVPAELTQSGSDSRPGHSSSCRCRNAGHR